MSNQNIKMALLFPDRESMYKAALLLCKRHEFGHAFGNGIYAIVFEDLHDIEHAVILSHVVADAVNKSRDIKAIGFEFVNVDTGKTASPVLFPKINPN